MATFPQLTTGAVTMYPVSRALTRRTVVNTMLGGAEVKYTDSDGALAAWKLSLRGMTAAEAQALAALYTTTNGGWQAFTFLDPLGNLLSNSETPTGSGWSRDPQLQFTTGRADPLGGAQATGVVNGGQAAQGLSQVVAGPETFVYCMSLWARTDSGSSIALSASATSTATSTIQLTPSWQRYPFAVQLGGSGSSVTFGIQLAAGATADIYGVQVEAQPAMSDYKKTAAQSGVYPNARFKGGALAIIAQGTDVFDATVEVTARCQ